MKMSLTGEVGEMGLSAMGSVGVWECGGVGGAASAAGGGLRDGAVAKANSTAPPMEMSSAVIR